MDDPLFNSVVKALKKACPDGFFIEKSDKLDMRINTARIVVWRYRSMLDDSPAVLISYYLVNENGSPPEHWLCNSYSGICKSLTDALQTVYELIAQDLP